MPEKPADSHLLHLTGRGDQCPGGDVERTRRETFVSDESASLDRRMHDQDAMRVLRLQMILVQRNHPVKRKQKPVTQTAYEGAETFETVLLQHELRHADVPSKGIAAGARSILDRFREETVVGHADWCSKHLRFEGGKSCVVYDWDSLRLDVEPAIAGGAAVTFPANRHLDAPNLPTPEETWLFVEDYETTRGHSFSPRERPVVTAAAVYTLAYLARCEHAADPESSGSSDYRSALQEHARAYFSADA